jgi:hypothetical protein
VHHPNMTRSGGAGPHEMVHPGNPAAQPDPR